MHPLFFGIKKTHIRIVECGKAIMSRYAPGLTPARFDLLRTVKGRGGDVPQAALVELLGVAHATVSRMIKGLEKSRFIRRYRESHDHRLKRVILTRRGKKILARALEVCVKWHNAHHMALAIANGDRHASPGSVAVWRRVERLTDLLVAARRILRDPSPLRYPWREGQYLDLPAAAFEWNPPNHRPFRWSPRPKPDAFATWEYFIMQRNKAFRQKINLPPLRLTG